MLYYAKIYLTALVTFLMVDLSWLGVIASRLYRSQLGHALAPRPNWPAAILFYLLFVTGVLLFVVIPGLEKGSLRWVLFYGALFGLVTYGTYDLTNLATLKDWPLTITIVDIAWGTFLSSTVSVTTFVVGLWMAK
jgi:uncharacterized membrane protein